METERTIVAIGSSTHWDYSLPLPLACLLWRDVIGHEPRALLVGGKKDWQKESLTEIALETLRAWKISYAFVGRVPGFDDGTVAQSARQHAAADSAIPDDQWVMMSDADLLPLQRGHYQQHVGAPARAVCYHGNGDCFQGPAAALAGWDAGVPFQSIPTCHVAMRAADWRALYGLTGDIRASLKRTLEEVLAPRIAGKTPGEASDACWHFDQYYLTERICRTFSPAEAVLLRRDASVDRLDSQVGRAADWVAPFDAGRWVDAHVRKGIYAERRWEPLVRIAGALLPDRAAEVGDYFERAASEC